MRQGAIQACDYLRHLPILLMVLALPAASMSRVGTTGPIEPPAPSVAQRALIEAHDTTRIGWWSSPAEEIDPAQCANDAPDEPADATPPVLRRKPPPGTASE